MTDPNVNLEFKFSNALDLHEALTAIMNQVSWSALNTQEKLACKKFYTQLEHAINAAGEAQDAVYDASKQDKLNGVSSVMILLVLDHEPRATDAADRHAAAIRSHLQ